MVVYNTLAIIVTYADRYHLLKRVVQSCLNNGVNTILVVDNCSTTQSANKLKELEAQTMELHVIWNTENKGSAFAYKQGLKYAKNKHEGLIMLLDDDNMLEEGVLQKLKSKWKTKEENTKCLLAYRPDRELYKKAIEFMEPEYVLSPQNSFYGFDVWSKLQRIFKREKTPDTGITEGFLAYAPYGGMLFHSLLIDKIGYPREEFYLYSDDHEWSYRIYKSGYGIKLLTDYRIKDIDESWAISSKNIFETIKTASPLRIYYTIRNRLVFEVEERVKHKARHRFNLILFTFLLYLYCGNNQQYKVFKLAVKDGFQKNLGKKTDDYFNA